MKRVTRSAIAAVALALVVAGVVSAAVMFTRGGATTASTQTPAQQQQQQGGGPANNAAFQQFRQCMTDNGVTVSPGQRPDPNDPTVQKARQACAQYAPARPGGGFGGGGGAPASRERQRDPLERTTENLFGPGDQISQVSSRSGRHRS